ncbi:hypothetical protein Ancab_000299 [Ancistrocladus abbreviatus]
MRWSSLCSRFSNRGAVFNCCHRSLLVSLRLRIGRPNQHELNRGQLRSQHSVPSFENQNPEIKLLAFIENVEDKLEAEALHAKLIKYGSVGDLDVGNYMLSLYVRFRYLSAGQNLFDEMLDRDVRTWTTLISGFARIGLFRLGLECFTQMLFDGVCPNQFTLSSVFKCCSSEVRVGKGIHGWMLRNGIGLDVVLKNSVLDFYIKCGELDYGKRYFEFMDDRNTMTWNIMVAGCIENGDVENSLDLFRRLPCKDNATWNTVISGLMQCGYQQMALEVLHEMINSQVAFCEYTFSIALCVASSLSTLELGRQIHGRLTRIGFFDNDFLRSCLIDMYSKCGEIDMAAVIFKQMPKDILSRRNLKFKGNNLMDNAVSFSSIVSGYVQNGRWEDAVEIFCNLVSEGIKVDKFTITSTISASADCGMLEFGQQIHAVIMKSGHKIDLILCSSLVDMYAKCGSLCDAQLTFNEINNQNVVCFTSIISGCALHGQGREAIQVFELMRTEGIPPNEVTFVGVLTACSHAGLVDEGFQFFELMKEVCNIKPGVEHFTCMVDLLGRAGRLHEIKNFIDQNSISHLSSVWRAFLSACRVHKNVEMGEWVAQKLLELEPLDAEPYILLSNMRATGYRWEDSARVRHLMQIKGIKKPPGQSWIHLNNQIHTFVMGDRSHSQAAEIYSYLDKLVGRLKEIGYCPDVEQVMHDVEEEQREIFLHCHSEKLAVVFGIISTSRVVPIRIMKNLRVCIDCHNFLKYTSQLLGREIIVRDIHRFHHFMDGSCSCGDYWCAVFVQY